jgi:CubicO group peptidase (beta-lactamase class C family)
LFAGKPLEFEPGKQFQYSNAGYIVLGAIIERLSGQDYYSYVKEHIYAPAGMTDTGFYEPGKQIPNLAVGYTRMGPDGKPTDQVHDNTDRLEIKGGPAGGGYSTVNDLVKFHVALRSFKLLDREHTELATKGKVDAGGPIGRYGYGFGADGEGALRSYGHNGGAPGMNGDLRVFPQLGYVVVALSNLDPPAASRLVDYFVARMPAAP